MRQILGPKPIYVRTLTILLVMAALLASHAPAAPDDSLTELLNQLTDIRIIVSQGPNLGHESTAGTVFTRLRQLGYKGHIQVVYPDTFPSTREKLARVLPPFSVEGPVVQEYPEMNLSFIPRDKAEGTRATLGIVGATDELHIPLRKVGVDILITLQPLQWKTEKSFHKIEYRTDSASGSRLQGYYKDLFQLGYVFELPRPTDLELFVHSNMDHDSELSAKAAGLITILNHARELMPVYGHNMANEWQLSITQMAASRAMVNRPDLFKSGVVVPVFNEFYNEKIQHFLAQHRNQNLVASDIQDPMLGEKIENLKPPQVLLVFTGRVSKPVFEYLYTRATVAPVIEGKNSTNLMQLIGKPYLPSSQNETFHFDQQDRSQMTAEETDAYLSTALPALKGIAGLLEAEEDPNLTVAAGLVSDFIVQAKIAGSPLNQLFKTFMVREDDLEHDKLYQSLQLARERLGQVICDGYLKAN